MRRKRRSGARVGNEFTLCHAVECCYLRFSVCCPALTPRTTTTTKMRSFAATCIESTRQHLEVRYRRCDYSLSVCMSFMYFFFAVFFFLFSRRRAGSCIVCAMMFLCFIHLRCSVATATHTKKNKNNNRNIMPHNGKALSYLASIKSTQRSSGSAWCSSWWIVKRAGCKDKRSTARLPL